MPKWKLGHKTAIMVYRLTDDGEVWMKPERGLRSINAVEHLSAEIVLQNLIIYAEGGFVTDRFLEALRAYAKEFE